MEATPPFVGWVTETMVLVSPASSSVSLASTSMLLSTPVSTEVLSALAIGASFLSLTLMVTAFSAVRPPLSVTTTVAA